MWLTFPEQRQTDMFSDIFDTLLNTPSAQPDPAPDFSTVHAIRRGAATTLNDKCLNRAGAFHLFSSAERQHAV